MNFGSPPILANELACDIAAQICIGRDFPTSLAAFEKCGRRNWTASLHQIMARRGEQLGMEVAYEKRAGERVARSQNGSPHQKVYENSEFLFDHVWFDKAGKMMLAAEFEMSRYGYNVKEDFLKLVYAKAPLKVCVFCDHRGTKETVDELATELNRLNGYVADEHYVVIRLCNWKSQQLEAFYVRPDGTSRVEFKQTISLPWKK